MGADADRFALEEEAAWIELHAAFDQVPGGSVPGAALDR